MKTHTVTYREHPQSLDKDYRTIVQLTYKEHTGEKHGHYSNQKLNCIETVFQKHCSNQKLYCIETVFQKKNPSPDQLKHNPKRENNQTPVSIFHSQINPFKNSSSTPSSQHLVSSASPPEFKNAIVARSFSLHAGSLLFPQISCCSLCRIRCKW